MARSGRAFRVWKPHSRFVDAPRTSGPSRLIGQPGRPRQTAGRDRPWARIPLSRTVPYGRSPILRSDSVIDSGGSSRHAAVFATAALDRSLAHRAKLNVHSPMRRNRADMAVATRRQGSGNSAATLGQLCIKGSGGGSSSKWRRSRVLSIGWRCGAKRWGVRVIGVRATLGQLYVNCHGNRQGSRQL